MKHKCSFILKASLALVLALVMLFGTVATSVAAVVEDDLADTGADVDIVDEGADVDIVGEGADVDIAYEGADVDLVETGDETIYVRYQKDMPTGNWDGNTDSPVMTKSSVDSNKYYCVVDLNANSSYGFFIRKGSNQYFKPKDGNQTITHNGHVKMEDKNNSNYGGCADRVTYSTNSATKYVFTYDISKDEVYVSPLGETVVLTWDVASGHDGNWDLDNKDTMSSSADFIYTKDVSLTNSYKYYLFAKVGDEYYKGTSTLSHNSYVNLYDYGSNNLGNSGDKVNYTANATASFRFIWDNRDKTMSIRRLYTVSYANGNVPTGGGSISGTTPSSQTKVYGTNLTLATNAFTVSQGYTQDGWTTTNGGTTKNYSSGGSYTSNSGTTLYPYWKETTSVVTFQRKLGDAAATQLTTKNSGIKTAATYTAPAVDGYTFAGWSTTSTLSSDTYAYTATLNDPSVTDISVNAKTAITLVANYTENKSGVALDAYTNGALSLAGGSLTIDGEAGSAQNTIQVGIATKVTAASTPGSGYSFLGWTIEGDDAAHVGLYTNSACSTAYTSGSTGTIYIKSDGTLGANPDVTIKAHFQSSDAKYITIYNNTMYDRQHWVVVSSPPQQVKVTNPAGTTKVYKYAAGTQEQRGEDNVSTTKNSATAVENKVNTNNATYYEGNLLEVHEGDKVELIYSALASSDIITGVFYNNTIRYTTEKEDDNLFAHRTYRDGGYGDKEHGYHDLPSGVTVPDDDVDFDYHDDTTHASASTTGGYALYANQYYYNTELAEVVAAQNYTATVDQDTHTVTWTVGNQDYLNIDMELNSKKEIHFSDTVNAKIHEVHTDNYYAVGEDVSPSTTETGSLSIKAAGNSTQTNTITKANIKFYYCNNMGEYINPVNGKIVSKANRVELKEGDATLTVVGSAASISNSGTDPSTNFYYIDGPMPATDVMVDLDMSITYSLTMKSKIMYDGVNSKTAFLQVADLTLGTTKKTQNNSYDTSTTVTSSPATCTSGNSITFKADNITSGYMFVGWFLDKNGAPDLASEPLSRNTTFSYKPTASVTVWAVGTRNLYINGSRYLFSGTRTDWQNDNVEMKYDSERQLYYHEIDSTIFTAANSNFLTQENTNDWVGDNDNAGTGGKNYGYKVVTTNNVSKYYWMSRNDATHGNAYFQIINEPTGHSDNTKKTVWGGVYSFRTQANGITVGKAQRRGEDDSNEDNRRNGQGFIDFSTSRYSGYDVPLRIYFNPATSALTAEATPVYPHIHVSNGYKDIDVGTPSDVTIKVNDGTAASNSSTGSPANSYMTFNSYVSPKYEGRVSDITVKARNATLTLTKTTASADYKVSNFLVYNMTKGTVKAHPATNTSGNTYSCDTIKTSDDDRLYIIPIVEYCGSNDKITIIVDSTKLDYKKWGKLVSCYAWGSNGDACGAYPGQLMVPSDDGSSWTATFEAPSTLTGILFGNYVDSGDGQAYTFLTESGVMGSVSDAQQKTGTATGGYVNVYNHISSGDNGEYSRTNCKVQTYDYREPIAYYKNRPANASNTTLTFALKDGNSNLLSRSHAQLEDVNILTLKKRSDGTSTGWSALKWEYLTDSSGDYYSDLNGNKLPEKPTASFYIAAKGMVIYKDNEMKTVFKTGSTYDSGITGVTYNDYKGKVADEIDMNYAVQWYVYDAAGNYITDVLSAGFADKSSANNDMSVVTQRLLDLGYAVEGRSVKICYDKPRYCYWDDDKNEPKVNNGNSFNVYRFTGQWYQDSEYKTAKVYAKVGIKTDNGEDVADASSAPYGSVSVSVDNSKCSIAGYSGTGTEGEVDYGYTTIVDGDSGALTLTASDTNFIGWYHYVTTYDSSDIESSETTQELVFDTDNPVYKPNYSKDVTYIALYEAKVNYSYKYIGREGGIKYYNVGSDTHLTPEEIAAGNKVDKTTHLYEATNNLAGAKSISMFKKTIDWAAITSSNVDNKDEYVLTVDNFSKLVASYTLTVRYYNGSKWDTEDINVQYNTAIDLTARHNGEALTGLWSGHNFIGWYEYNNGTVGNLLSSQANYGMVMVKDQTITAVYEGDGTNTTAPAENDEWQVFVDDHGPTYEKTSATAGTVYTDAIVRVRKNRNNVTTLDENARVGYLIVDDNGTDKTIDTSKLKIYANALQSASGKTGNAKVTESGQSYTLKVTNLYTTSVNTFGRADLAAKSSLASVSGHRYYIYAYYYDGKGLDNVDNYHFNTTPVTGTY